MLLAYIYRSITHRVHFLDKASRDLFISAKDLFVEAMERKRPRPHGDTCWPGQVKAERVKCTIRPFPLCKTLGRTLPKWRSLPSEDLSDYTKELFIAAIGHYKLVRPD